MTQTPVDLDTAIDAVAKQLTRVEHDPHLSARIAMSLPVRSSWSFRWWAPRLAMIAIIVAAGILWTTRAREVTQGVAPLATSQLMTTPMSLMATVREAEPDRTLPLEPLEPVEPVERLRADHERSLPAIAVVAALELESLTPASLPEDAPLTVAPLAVTDLPLTPDPISQQE